jgi:hypothetical protein
MSLISALVPNSVKSRVILPYLGNKRNPGNVKQLAIARNAINDLFVSEEPPGSNRSPRIDEYNTNFYSPIGSAWCANSAGTWVRDAGGKIPKQAVGDCDKWLELAIKENLFSFTPKIGSVALYGTRNDVRHIDIVIMLYPYLLSCGGNTTLAGFSRNGDIVAAKPIRTDLLVGYVEVWR